MPALQSDATPPHRKGTITKHATAGGPFLIRTMTRPVCRPCSSVRASLLFALFLSATTFLGMLVSGALARPLDRPARQDEMASGIPTLSQTCTLRPHEPHLVQPSVARSGDCAAAPPSVTVAFPGIVRSSPAALLPAGRLPQPRAPPQAIRERA